ncbi:hypothetical protein JTE90_023499 [Oedothorax gibbosus]|uniref:Uncharacterized protein n=1 Tax=Oedothorax gibbosus TaxID=931172 RepID=A0AAV6VR67_9ARAC|nr:hypothetical protein JTE90_023499 [Oedothorax gibbosus]
MVVGGPYRTRDQVFEERNDDVIEFGQKLPIGAAISKDVLGPDVEEENEVLQANSQEPPERDPLYVVHYVPQGKESTSQSPNTESGSDVLKKILSASKVGKGNGTPQFVVFAPSPDSREGEDVDMSSRTSRKKTRRRKKKMEEYEDDDEYPAHTQIRQQVTSHVPRPRHGDFESPDYHHHYPQHHPNYQPNYNHQPCCQQPPPTTMAPMNQPGLTIQMGNGLPMSPLGMLRQLLRPKVDLKKKLFFGVQLENGLGFGGDNATPAPAMGGNMGNMGGNMGNKGGMGGQMYTFSGK